MVETVRPWTTPAGSSVMIATGASSVLIPYGDLPAIINALNKHLQHWQEGQPAAKPSRGMQRKP